MNSQIFEECIHKPDQNFRADGTKAVLLLDNCPTYPPISNFPNIQLIFLSLNTTSVLQPMGHGVIRSLKAHYIEWVVQLLCSPLEKGYPNPKMLILQAMKVLVTS